MQNIIKYLLIASCFSLLIACEKEETNRYSYDANLISMIISDNANLSQLDAANKRTELHDMLLQEGPYTQLAPSDDAFTTDVNTIGLNRLTNIMQYHVLNGIYDFNKLPFQFNQEIYSYTGGKMFVTKWTKGVDTVITINGAIITPVMKDAKNGKIQVINRVLEPYLFDYLSDAVGNEYEITLFNQVLERVPAVRSLLQNEGAYTLYAPNNAAMASYGYSTLEIINEKPVEELERLVQYHIVPDRRFVYDYVLTTPTSGNTNVTTTETMLNGDNLTLTLVFNSGTGTYNKITLLGTRNTTQTNLTRENILAGNGVLHIIDQVLLH
ncbi:fasciclin domain-containing protein [Sphingobacterium arenae]|uniref:Fasciclin domain-containing protein n=1 Tax=Sphingobacterium arenae TaxID=1280598 RepID=A0ABR7Y3C7_9SPHI|nr:fasciclin domain-containing protein [Sphingobacterium arenae]MBD1425802.1 fasciclin domain-containing protein [Sphingobacterium arenae]